MAKTWKIYEVTVRGYGTATYTATSPAKARAEAWRCDAFCHMTFKQFLAISTVRRRADPLVSDGYDYIRRAYGVSPTIGQRVRLQNEGSNWNGKEGTVIYPGVSTAHVRVVMDGMDCPSIVHPLNVELLPAETPASHGCPSCIRACGGQNVAPLERLCSPGTADAFMAASAQ